MLVKLISMFLSKTPESDDGEKKKRPLASNRLAVITSEHHINLLAHGEVTLGTKDNKKCCDVDGKRGKNLVQIAQHDRATLQIHFS